MENDAQHKKLRITDIYTIIESLEYIMEKKQKAKDYMEGSTGIEFWEGKTVATESKSRIAMMGVEEGTSRKEAEKACWGHGHSASFTAKT